MQRTKNAQTLLTPGQLAKIIEPSTIQTPALDILDQALMDAESGKHPWLIFTMPPQEGKSQRVSRFFPLWCLLRDPKRRVAIVSYGDDLAMRWGRQDRNDISADPALGLAIAPDVGASKEWQLDGHMGGMITTGISGGLTGRPVEVLIIDDPLKDQKEADSVTIRETCKNFWRSTASSRLGEKSIVIVVMTRWHEDDLAGWLMQEQPGDFRLINIPAQADHDPNKGETDILEREPGEYMISTRERTDGGWEKRKRSAGSRAWNALYQGRPAPAEGGVFNRAWWVCRPLKAAEKDDGSWFVPGADEVIQSWDMTFKDTKGSDYVVGQVWARRGPKAWLIDEVRGQMEFTVTCAAFRNLTAKWPQATRKIVEDKANGPAVISQLRTDIGGIVAFTPVDSKLARARAVAPFVEAGDVAIPDPAEHPWVAAFIEECASFPNAAHDDRVDAMSQALHQLLLVGAGSTYMDELMAEQGAMAMPDEVVSHVGWSPQEMVSAGEPWL